MVKSLCMCIAQYVYSVCRATKILRHATLMITNLKALVKDLPGCSSNAASHKVKPIRLTSDNMQSFTGANLAQPPCQISMATLFHSYLSSTDIADTLLI